MGTLNDEILRATGGPTVNDGLRSWFSALATETLNDAERRWLGEQGAPPAGKTINDQWMIILSAIPGTLNDKQLAYWSAQGISAPIIQYDETTIVGDPVTAWEDSKGFGTPFDVVTGISGNLIQTLVNGLPAIQSLGDVGLQKVVTQIGKPCTVVFVARQEPAVPTDAGTMHDGALAGGRLTLRNSVSGTGDQWYVSGDGASGFTTARAPGVSVFTMTVDDLHTISYVNNVLVHDETPNSSTFLALFYLFRSSGAAYIPGIMCEIRGYDYAMDASQRQAVYDELNTKWNL